MIRERNNWSRLQRVFYRWLQRSSREGLDYIAIPLNEIERLADYEVYSKVIPVTENGKYTFNRIDEIKGIVIYSKE